MVKSEFIELAYMAIRRTLGGFQRIGGLFNVANAVDISDVYSEIIYSFHALSFSIKYKYFSKTNVYIYIYIYIFTLTKLSFKLELKPYDVHCDVKIVNQIPHTDYN